MGADERRESVALQQRYVAREQHQRARSAGEDSFRLHQCVPGPLLRFLHNTLEIRAGVLPHHVGLMADDDRD